MRPVIGITAGFQEEEKRYHLSADYTEGIYRAGGLPVILPSLPPEAVPLIVTAIDGLLLSGGGDLDPYHFGEEPSPQTGQISPRRDSFELSIAREALSRRLPILGICRGMQVLNVAGGGTIYQDLSLGIRQPLKHYQEAPRWYTTHQITIREGSKLAAIFRTTTLRVNSFHHQAVKKVAPDFAPTAWAPDGVIEAIEAVTHPFAIGVQFHPEGMWEKDPLFLELFIALITACSELYK